MSTTPKDLFDRLYRPFDEKLKQTKRQGGATITFVPWPNYIGRAWQDFTEGFSTEVRSVHTVGALYKATNEETGEPEEIDDRQVVVVVRITDRYSGIYHEATGAAPASKDKATWGGAMPEAESQALRRAFAKFGLGLEMYLNDDEFEAFASEPEPEPEEEDDSLGAAITESQVARLRGLGVVLAEHGLEDEIEAARVAVAAAANQKAVAGVEIRRLKALLEKEGIEWNPEDPS